jgi:hypothetical protein
VNSVVAASMPKKVAGRAPSPPAALRADPLPAAATPAAAEEELPAGQPACEGDSCPLPSFSAPPAAPASLVAAPAPAPAPPSSDVPSQSAPLVPRAASFFRAPVGWEWLLIAAVVAVTCSARFYRLDHPAGITFDELHFGKFVMWGMNQWFYLCVGGVGGRRHRPVAYPPSPSPPPHPPPPLIFLHVRPPATSTRPSQRSRWAFSAG